jgi:hypothetical protein
MLVINVLDIGRRDYKCRQNFEKKLTYICNGYLKGDVVEGVISIWEIMVPTGILLKV